MGTIVDKLNYLNDTKVLIRNKLNKFGAELNNENTFRSYATFLEDLYNDYPTVSDVGSNVTLNNTKKAPLKKLDLNPTELTQDGTSSPDNPVDVNVITGSNNINITNTRNLFDFNNITIRKLGTYGTVTVENNEIKFTATGQQVYGIQIDLSELNLKNNTTYTIANLFSITTSQNPNGWRYYNGSSYTVLNNYREYFTFTTTESGVNQLLYYIGSPATFDGTLTIYNIQLLEGEILERDIPTYIPYSQKLEQNYPITLSSVEYCKIGDYADQIFKNTIDSEFYDSTLLENEWYLKKNIGKIIFDGSETNWLKDGNSYKINQSDMLTANVGNGLCNYFKNSRIDYSYTAGHIRFGWSNTYIYFYVDTETIADVNAWKDWLSTHNTKVYYQLATPQYTHISQADYPILRSQLENLYNNAKSYNGQTNITQTNDGLPFNIELSALMKGDD